MYISLFNVINIYFSLCIYLSSVPFSLSKEDDKTNLTKYQNFVNLGKGFSVLFLKFFCNFKIIQIILLNIKHKNKQENKFPKVV